MDIFGTDVKVFCPGKRMQQNDVQVALDESQLSAVFQFLKAKSRVLCQMGGLYASRVLCQIGGGGFMLAEYFARWGGFMLAEYFARSGGFMLAEYFARWGGR